MARAKAPKKAERELSALEKRFAAFKPASQVLTNVRAVPTCFIQFDHAVRCGGWPLERPAIIHGPSSHGKTVFLLGIARSFLALNHFVHWNDAEQTTAAKWVEELLADLVKHPRFYAARQNNYEKFVDETRAFHRSVKDARTAGEIEPLTSAITIVDSLRKLVPEDIMAKIKKHGAGGEKGSVDGMGGRGAQIRAAMNAAWLDELVPLVAECGTTWAGITRETTDTDADEWEKRRGDDFTVGGGKALIFDSSLVCRILRDGWVTIGPKEGPKEVIGERHEISIWKTKVGGKEERKATAYFHTSNGKQSPYGFDFARDAVELALKLGVITQNGSSYGWPSRDIKSAFSGRENMVQGLRDCPDDLVMLQDECRAKFDDHDPSDASAAASEEAQ